MPHDGQNRHNHGRSHTRQGHIHHNLQNLHTRAHVPIRNLQNLPIRNLQDHHILQSRQDLPQKLTFLPICQAAAVENSGW